MRAALRSLCPAIAATALAASAPACAAADKAGPHDFDFNFGTWNTHIKRLLHPLTGAPAMAEYDGTSTVSKIWGGRANLFELVADGPAGHIEGLGLRLYNRQAHQWTLNWASSADGEFQRPMTGQFAGHRPKLLLDCIEPLHQSFHNLE